MHAARMEEANMEHEGDDVTRDWRALDCPQGAQNPDAWLKNMVHDIRQPLSALHLVSATLAGAPSDEESAEDLRSLTAGLEYLTELVSELEDGHSVSTGDLEVMPATFDVGALVTEAVTTFQLRARVAEKRLGAVLPGLRVSAYSDRRLLKRVLCNLIDNALRHGRARGRVTIWLEVVGDELRLRVEDDGPGLPADFDLSLEGSRRARGGRGVGLLFCAKACRALGGALRTWTGEGGARLLVQIPLNPR